MAARRVLEKSEWQCRRAKSGGLIFRSATVVATPLTSNLAWADVPVNVFLAAHATNLRKDSVANATQVISLDKELLIERVGKLTRARLDLLFAAVDAVLGR